MPAEGLERTDTVLKLRVLRVDGDFESFAFHLRDEQRRVHTGCYLNGAISWTA